MENNNNNNTSRKRVRDSSYTEDYSYGRQYLEIEQAMSFNFETDSALPAELREWQPSPAVFPPTSQPTFLKPEPAAQSVSRTTGLPRTTEKAQEIKERTKREAPGRKAQSQAILQWRQHNYDRLPKEMRDLDAKIKMPTSREAESSVNKKMASLLEYLVEELEERGIEVKNPLAAEWVNNIRTNPSIKDVDDVYEKFKNEKKEKQSDQPKQ